MKKYWTSGKLIADPMIGKRARNRQRHQTHYIMLRWSESVCIDIMFCNRSASALNFEKKNYARTKMFRKIRPLYSCSPSQDRHAHINFIGYFVCQLRGVPSGSFIEIEFSPFCSPLAFRRKAE